MFGFGTDRTETDLATKQGLSKRRIWGEGMLTIMPRHKHIPPI